MRKYKIIRVTTVPISMNIILKGQLAFMNKFFIIIGVTGRDDKHFNEIRDREGIVMLPVSMSRNISVFNDIRSLYQLCKVFIKEKPDIVHTHTPKAGLLGMIASYITKTPIRIHTVAGMPIMGLSGLKKRIVIFFEKLTYKLAQKVYPNSVGLMNFIIEEKYCIESKLKVIGNGASNGVNTSYFYPFAKDLKSKNYYKIKFGVRNCFVFLFVGRIAKEKGIVEMISSFLRLVSKYPQKDIKLCLIGTFEKENGSVSTKIKKTIENNDKILHLGRFDDVRPFYLMSDVFLLPSYREGFPNALLEAGSMGVPSITTDINGCNEIIFNHKNGLLIPAKNKDALFRAMENLLIDNKFKNQLASKSRNMIVDLYDNTIVWKALHEEYDLLIKKYL